MRTVTITSPFSNASEKKRASLLESLEAMGEKPYSECRDGYCGCCKAKKISGNIEYINEPLASVNDDEVLLCCSAATSSTVEVSF